MWIIPVNKEVSLPLFSRQVTEIICNNVSLSVEVLRIVVNRMKDGDFLDANNPRIRSPAGI